MMGVHCVSGWRLVVIAALSVSACNPSPGEIAANGPANSDGGDPEVTLGPSETEEVQLDPAEPLSALTLAESRALCEEEIARTDPCLLAGIAQPSPESCEATVQTCREGLSIEATASCESANYAVTGCDASVDVYLSCIEEWNHSLSCERAGEKVLAPPACVAAQEQCRDLHYWLDIDIERPGLEAFWSPDPSIPPDQVVGNDLTLEPPAQGFQLRTGGVWIQPGEDIEYFEILEVPGEPGSVHYVTRIEIEMTGFTHHALLFAVRPGSTAEASLTVGSRGTGTSGLVLFLGGGDPPTFERITGSQQPYTDERYPPGVGRILHGGQKILVDYHYLNTSTEPAPAGHRVNFHTSDGVESVARQFLWMNTDISIPPHATAVFEHSVRFSENTMVFALTRHTHRIGTEFDVFFHGGPRDGEHIFTSYDWEADTHYTFPDAGVLLRDGEGFRWVCNYDNPFDVTVSWGEEASDEMCILVGLQYDPPAGSITP